MESQAHVALALVRELQLSVQERDQALANMDCVQLAAPITVLDEAAVSTQQLLDDFMKQVAVAAGLIDSLNLAPDNVVHAIAQVCTLRTGSNMY